MVFRRCVLSGRRAGLGLNAFGLWWLLVLVLYGFVGLWIVDCGLFDFYHLYLVRVCLMYLR